MSKGKSKGKQKRSGPTHVRPEQPLIPAGQKGFWRLKHLIAYLGISASEYYKHAGARYPKPDLYRGRVPVWRSENFS
jgi:hypothetical protein